jgi:hypothetical protein
MKFHEIRPVWAELSRAVRHNEASSRFTQLCERAQKWWCGVPRWASVGPCRTGHVRSPFTSRPPWLAAEDQPWHKAMVRLHSFTGSAATVVHASLRLLWWRCFRFKSSGIMARGAFVFKVRVSTILRNVWNCLQLDMTLHARRHDSWTAALFFSFFAPRAATPWQTLYSTR